MSPGRFLQGSAYTALAALMGTIALPDVVSAREEGEERNAMQIRGERVQQANAERQQQRAQQAEQRAAQVDRRTEGQVVQADRGSTQRAAQADRQGDRAAWQTGCMSTKA